MSDPERDLERAEEMLEAIKRGAAQRKQHIQPNECPACGAYRLDGHPPEVHKHNCPYKEDSLDRTLRRMFGGSE